MYRLLLLGIATCAGYIFIRRTKRYWIQLLFPVGYYLYTTRLGYRLHLRQLSNRRATPHSITQPLSLSGFTVVPLAILGDNYSYVVFDEASKVAVAVDAADPEAVKNCVQEKNLSLRALLTTHKHWDHSGGNEALKGQFKDLAVYGGARDSVPGATHLVQDQDTITIGRISFEVIWTPGHTKGHVVYVLQSTPLCVFTGDHLFIGGTGKMFECSPETMVASIKKISQLPRNSLLFPGHEYTWANVKFIDSLHEASSSGENAIDTRNKLHWVTQQREKRIATIPAVLSEELRYSPYLQTCRASVKDLLGLPPHTSEDQVLAELRRRKNLYNPLQHT
jgi:hydroxyacylglutathione hydrolase